MPRAPWVMTQSWHDLLFAHWRVDAAEVRRAVPAPFELELFDGDAWLGIVPFHMSNVGLRGTPAIPWLSAFPELNVRTYVRVGERPGVYFFSLDAARWLAVAAARACANLPYHAADMMVECRGDGVRYDSARRAGNRAEFKGVYAPTGDAFTASPGSLEHFLTERYCLYHHNRRGQPFRVDIHHPPWSLQVADAEISLNSMAAANRLTVHGAPALLHYARRQDVVAWLPARLPAPPANEPTITEQALPVKD